MPAPMSGLGYLPRIFSSEADKNNEDKACEGFGALPQNKKSSH